VPLHLLPDDTRAHSLPRPRTPLGFATGFSGEPNAGAVAPGFEQREPERVPLGAGHFTDKSPLLRSHPITPLVFRDLEMMRRGYRPWDKADHIRSADAVDPVALSSIQTIGSLPLDFEKTLSGIA
jgi:hypothetical protein